MNQTFNEDCLVKMKDFSDGQFDLILCDLPYGTTDCSWDILIPFDQLWLHYKRILKNNGAVLLFGQEPFSSLQRISNLSWYKYDLYWQKERPTNFFNLKKRFGKTTETISVFYKNQPTYNPQKELKYPELAKNPQYQNRHSKPPSSVTTGFAKNFVPYLDDGTRYPTDVLRFNRDNNRTNIHETQKPVALLQYLIRSFTNEGDLILDNCAGSGSLGIAAHKENRKFVLIEKDLNNYQKMIERLKKENVEYKDCNNL